jgi:alginate O-acetyltransferase complex protein AlgI
MLFNSCQFLFFFLMVTALFYALPQRFRWGLLLLASCYFYMVFVPKYILILFFLVIIDYTAGLVIEPARGAKRKLLLVISLVANIGVLSFFKYFNFAEGEVARWCGWLGMGFQPWHLNVILPIGLSFHTFQSMSYTIEVYRGVYRAERHLGVYALYVLFYPQMVAGPIERPQNLLAQLRTPVTFHAPRLVAGIELMLWGLFKKVVIADNLALIVDPAFANPQTHQGGPMILATYAFAFQIYCDFSGYTDIARGAARTMGYHLRINFDIPYHAQSISEFWHRWHISLSSWFRDYVYIPLGGSRVGEFRHYLNLLVVFVVSGLWHGANWAFVVWGALHGVYLIIGQATHTLRQKFWQRTGFAEGGTARVILAVLVTFHLVLVGWVFFRAGTLAHAREVFLAMLSFPNGGALFPARLDWFHRTGLALSMIFLAGAHLIHRRHGLRTLVARLPRPLYLGLFCGGIFWIFLWGRFTSHDFIYFQF